MPKKPAKKARKPARKRQEKGLQLRTAQWLEQAMPNLLAFHVANERRGGFGTHMHFKRMGVKAGVADWLVFPRNGRKIAIELKDDKGEQSADQEQFQKHWETTGGMYFVCRTLEEFQGTVKGVTLF